MSFWMFQETFYSTLQFWPSEQSMCRKDMWVRRILQSSTSFFVMETQKRLRWVEPVPCSGNTALMQYIQSVRKFLCHTVSDAKSWESAFYLNYLHIDRSSGSNVFLDRWLLLGLRAKHQWKVSRGLNISRTSHPHVSISTWHHSSSSSDILGSASHSGIFIYSLLV